MLMNKNPKGFERHVMIGWSVCGGSMACVIDPEQTVMRRPADHELGYGILCLKCSEQELR